MPASIEAIAEVSLLYPYASSLRVLEELCNLWALTIVRSSTREERAVVRFPWNKYKRMFQTNPVVGVVDVPPKLTSFISRIEVKEVVLI